MAEKKPGARRSAGKANEDDLRLAIEAAEMGVWEWDLRSGEVSWSSRVRSLFGLPPTSSAKGSFERLLEQVHPDDRAAVAQGAARAIAIDDRLSIEHRVLWPDGSLHWLACHGQVARRLGGEALRLTGLAWDISERKQAEEELRLREEQYRTLVEQAADAIFLLTPEGRVIDANSAACRLFGYGHEEALGMSVVEFIAPEDLPTLLDRHAQLGAGKTLVAERRMRRKDGSFVTVELSSKMLADGRVQGFARDITERKELQAQLIFADRMASVGTLAAGVAHEINNPLAFILLNLGYVAKQLSAKGGALSPTQNDELLRLVAETREGAERVAEIVRDLKAFSRGDDERKGPVDVRTVLDSAIGIVEHEIRRRARLVKDFQEVPLLEANDARVGQVFLNLLMNAAQSISEGAAEKNEIRVRTSTGPGDSVVVEISDTGEGISPALRDRIFDPFFTTKPVGVGTGLGLSICHHIVTSLQGHIEVKTSLRAGSTFRVVLPSAQVSVRAINRPLRIGEDRCSKP